MLKGVAGFKGVRKPQSTYVQKSMPGEIWTSSTFDWILGWEF
jgi:hypothetical protein